MAYFISIGILVSGVEERLSTAKLPYISIPVGHAFPRVHAVTTRGVEALAGFSVDDRMPHPVTNTSELMIKCQALLQIHPARLYGRPITHPYINDTDVFHFKNSELEELVRLEMERGTGCG